MDFPLESVPNVSEGRDAEAIAAIGAAFAAPGAAARRPLRRGSQPLGLSRSSEGTKTLVESLLAGIAAAAEHVDLRDHEGVHPCIGAADVVPLVPLRPEDMERARAAALRLARAGRRGARPAGLPLRRARARARAGVLPPRRPRGAAAAARRGRARSGLRPAAARRARRRRDRRRAQAADRLQRQPAHAGRRGGARDRGGRARDGRRLSRRARARAWSCRARARAGEHERRGLRGARRCTRSSRGSRRRRRRAEWRSPARSSSGCCRRPPRSLPRRAALRLAGARLRRACSSCGCSRLIRSRGLHSRRARRARSDRRGPDRRRRLGGRRPRGAGRPHRRGAGQDGGGTRDAAPPRRARAHVRRQHRLRPLRLAIDPARAGRGAPAAPSAQPRLRRRRPVPAGGRARGDAPARERAREGLLRRARRDGRAARSSASTAASLPHVPAPRLGRARAAISRRSPTSRCRSSARGEAWVEGELLPGDDALRAVGLEPIRLAAKEGLSLVNGTQFMAAMAALGLVRARRLAKAADVACALSLEALQGSRTSFLPAIHAARPLHGPGRLGRERPSPARGLGDHRVPPLVRQGAGRLLAALRAAGARGEPRPARLRRGDRRGRAERGDRQPARARRRRPRRLERELPRAAARLRARRPRDGGGRAGRASPSGASSGSSTRASRTACRRSSRSEGGLNSGFMIPQYVAAALVSENKVLVPSCERRLDPDERRPGGSRLDGERGRAEGAGRCSRTSSARSRSSCSRARRRSSSWRRSSRGSACAPPAPCVRALSPRLRDDRSLSADIEAVAGADPRRLARRCGRGARSGSCGDPPSPAARHGNPAPRAEAPLSGTPRSSTAVARGSCSCSSRGSPAASLDRAVVWRGDLLRRRDGVGLVELPPPAGARGGRGAGARGRRASERDRDAGRRGRGALRRPLAHPRAARHGAERPLVVDRGAAADAAQQPRRRGRRAAGGARRLRRLGQGRAHRTRRCRRSCARCCGCGEDETLLVQSGKPVGVFRTHAGAPRVLIANSLLVPRWATWDEFRRLEALGPDDVRPDDGRELDLHRHAGDPAGHVPDVRGGGREALRLARPRRAHDPDGRARRHGRRAAAGGDDGRRGDPVRRGRSVPDRAAARDAATSTRRRTRSTTRSRGCARRRPRGGRSRSACSATPPTSSPSSPRRGEHFDLVTDQTAAHDPLNGYVPAGLLGRGGGRAARVRSRTSTCGGRAPRSRAHVRGAARVRPARAAMFSIMATTCEVRPMRRA